MKEIRAICENVNEHEYNRCLYLCMKMYPHRMRYRRFNSSDNLYSLYWNLSEYEFEELIQ